MKALIKWGLMGTLSLVLLLVAAGLLIPVFVDVNDYKPRIESLVTEKTGRDFSLGGEIDLSLFPWVGVRLADVRLGNPKGFSSQDMVQVDAFEVRLKVMPLLQRRVEIKTFRLDSPRIYLERLKNGRANWVLEPPQAKSPTGKSPSSQGKTEQENREPGPGTLPIQDLDIAQLALIQGMVSFKDHGAGLEKELSQLNLSLKGVRLDQPIDLEFSVRLDGQPLSLTGRFGPLGPHPGRENIPLDLKLKALGEIDLSLMGSLLDPMGEVGLEAGISLAPFSPRKLVKALGRDFPVETQDPSVLGKLGLDTYFKGNAGEVFVRDGKLVLDDSLVKFSARAKSFEKPDLTFDLELDRLDLDRYLPPKKGTSGSSVAGAAPP
ncbi:MAG: AsmA family protein, partial [Desulfobacterales bacterium]|nr:AsmA family protein [Desulfobacterales bacterium]